MVQTHAIQRGRCRKYQPTTHNSPPPENSASAALAPSTAASADSTSLKSFTAQIPIVSAVPIIASNCATNNTATHASRNSFGWGSLRFHVVSSLKTKKLISFLVDQTKYVKFDVKNDFLTNRQDTNRKPKKASTHAKITLLQTIVKI